MPKTIESDMFRLFCRFKRTVVVDGWTFSMNTYNAAGFACGVDAESLSYS